MSVPARSVGVVRVLFRIEDSLLIAATITCVVALSAQVVSRYLLNTPLRWSEELARYLYVWMTFFGMGFGVRHDSHVRMLLIRSRLPQRAGRIVTAVADSVLLILIVGLFPGLIEFTRNQFGVLSTGMQLDMGLVYLSLPVGFGILALYLISQIAQAFVAAIRPKIDLERE